MITYFGAPGAILWHSPQFDAIYVVSASADLC